MFWNTITRIWTRLASQSLPALYLAPELKAARDGSKFNAPAVGEFEDPRAEPYVPSNDSHRSDSSLHLSC